MIQHHLTQTIKSLADLIGKSDPKEISYGIETAMFNMENLKRCSFPDVVLSDEQSSFSSHVMDYLRKYSDNPSDSALREFVLSGRGINMWASFVKDFLSSKKVFESKRFSHKDIVSRIRLKITTSDDNIMKGLIYGIDDQNFRSMYDLIKEWQVDESK